MAPTYRVQVDARTYTATRAQARKLIHGITSHETGKAIRLPAPGRVIYFATPRGAVITIEREA
jgi:hypothetical protein